VAALLGGEEVEMGVESDDEFRDFMRGRWSAMVAWRTR
jgi:hypothetical protein